MQQIESIAAATAVVGYDLLQDSDWQQQPYFRRILGVALKGSAAEADTEVEVFIGPVSIGKFKNTGTGYPNMDDTTPCSEVVAPGAKIIAKVTDAPATNAITLMMVVVP